MNAIEAALIAVALESFGAVTTVSFGLVTMIELPSYF
jgi:hypothetical protein